MALPELPVENEDPWFTKRNAFDEAVKSELEGRLSETQLNATIAAEVVPVKGRTRRDIERTTTGIVRRCELPAGLGWNPDIPIFTDGARYWSPFNVGTLRPAGGKTYYVMPSHTGTKFGAGLQVGTLTTSLETGTPVTSLPITAAQEAMSSGWALALVSGTDVLPVTLSASLALGATTATIVASSPSVRFPPGSKLVSVRNRIQDKYPTANPGDTFMLLDQVNYAGVLQDLVLDKSINLVGMSPGTVVTMSLDVAWALADGMSNVYQAASNQVRTVVDFALDEFGFEYTRAVSVAECEATPGSWHQAADGTGPLSMHTIQGGVPDNTVHHALKASQNVKILPPGGSVIYMENLRLIGGRTEILVECTDASRATFISKDCDFMWGGYGPVGASASNLISGLRVRGNTDSYLQRVRVAHSTGDGVGYSASGGYAPRYVELDCEAFACGVDSIAAALDPANATFNASTAHTGAIGIRVGGKYHHARGTIIADVQEGTRSALFGVDAWGSVSGFELFNAAIGAQQDGTEMWLYGCRAWGTVHDILSVGTGIVHVLEDTEYDSIGGDGTITTSA